MKSWFLFYNTVGVPLLYLSFQLLRFFHRKVRKGIRGRKRLFERLQEDLNKLGPGPRLWIHVSSLGEFEQAKPIAVLAKERWPFVKVIITFFSPSGYEHRGDTAPFADLVSYLPFDSPRNAQRFVSLIDPSAAIVVRHDIWPNHVRTTVSRGIPTVLVDASLPPIDGMWGTIRRAVYRGLFQEFTLICAISEQQAKLIEQLVPGKRVVACGDTRYDQVVRRAREPERIRDLASHPSFKNIDILVLGSTWPSDEGVVFPALIKCLKRPGTRAIVCPHEPTEDRVLEIREYFRERGIRALSLSGWRQKRTDDWDVLIVDTVGLLANLYALGNVAYVGGSFGPGVHSVLEPAAHGLPVVVGPRYQNSPDARLLVERGAATVVHNADEAEGAFLRLLDDMSARERAAVLALEIVREHTGASENVLEILAEYVKEFD